MQLCILESVRSIKGYEKASSTEFGKTSVPTISIFMNGLKKKTTT